MPIKNILQIIWWFRKLDVPLSFGEVAEWSIAAVLKTVELRGSGGSNPSLSANETKQEGVDYSTPFVFYAYGISSLIDVGMGNKNG